MEFARPGPWIRFGAVVLTVLLTAGADRSAKAEPLSIVAWNVESGGARLATLRGTIEELADIDIWALSEVDDDDWLPAFVEAAAVGETNRSYVGRLGDTGGNDRLALVYDSTRLDTKRVFELTHINYLGRVRAPLVGHFRLRSTGDEFLVVVNHLYRTNEEGRHEQSRLLREWAAEQTHPIIMTGDFNFDWHFQNGEVDHDRGYDLLTEGGTLERVRDSREPLGCGQRECTETKLMLGNEA
jgi:endonuclease/exonuclease/phosphatase (EEP) superfamily protein YafD